MNSIFSNICVIGLGVVGASFAAASKQAFPDSTVCGVDAESEILQRACSESIIDQGYLPQSQDLIDFLSSDCDLVVLATPSSVARDYLRLMASCGFDGVLTDTASTKSHIIEEADELLPNPSIFLPGHPMAGSEKSGIDASNSRLFEGAYWILCPNDDTPPQNYQRLHALITSLDARVITLPREEHDRAIALVSHVPHIVASSLVQLVLRHEDEQGSLFHLAAGGFKDSTRIAAGSPSLWSGILSENAEWVSSSIDELQGILAAFKETLNSGDGKRLTELLSGAADARNALPVRWTPSSNLLFELRVPMENHHGAVAFVTQCAAETGCNIQSIDIEHLTDQTAVLNMVLTDEGERNELICVLEKGGYQPLLTALDTKEPTHAREQ